VSTMPMAARPTLPGSRASRLTPQPPGPAPEGKVWSPEHGHWHDASAAAPQVVTTTGNTATPGANFVPAPQPAGPVPEGKVWSVEHGHWHDAPATPK
jgi:hypothetical protein